MLFLFFKAPKYFVTEETADSMSAAEALCNQVVSGAVPAEYTSIPVQREIEAAVRRLLSIPFEGGSTTYLRIAGKYNVSENSIHYFVEMILLCN